MKDSEGVSYIAALATHEGSHTQNVTFDQLQVISQIGQWPMYEDRFAEKRGFRLAHAACGGASDFRPALEAIP
jgi:hypothetical protein